MKYLKMLAMLTVVFMLTGCGVTQNIAALPFKAAGATLGIVGATAVGSVNLVANVATFPLR